MRIALTAPEPAVTHIAVDGLEMQWSKQILRLVVRTNTGVERRHEWTGQEAQAMIEYLCTADLRQRSLPQLALERLIADGEYEGAIVE